MKDQHIYHFFKRKRLLFLFVVCLFLIPNITKAQRTAFRDHKVKITDSYGAVLDNGIDWIVGFNFSVVDFSPSRIANISPLAGDPGFTEPILSDSNCPFFVSGDQVGGQVNITFNSLEQLGTWTILVESLGVPPGYCISYDGCTEGPSCDVAGVYEAIPLTYIITVFNDPPTASPNHSPRARWGRTVTLDANSNDPDGGNTFHSWSIINKPPSSSATLVNINSETPSIIFDNEGDIGDWGFRLHVDDDEGERRTFTHSFTVPNEEPNIYIDGSNDIDALETLTLSAVNSGASSPGNDVDGGALNFHWEVLSAPPGGSFNVGDTWSMRTISFTTTENDITTIDGTDNVLYTFRVTATDNEGDDDDATIDVRVHNLPPEVNLIGDNEIDAGYELRVETDIFTDEDGGNLQFSWDLVQTPNSSSIGPQSNYSSAFDLSIPTTENEAGTWIVQLNATDNEGETIISDKFEVLVDGLPTANIDGPEVIGSLSFPLVLDGSVSVDPDSPCGPPDYCHSTIDSPVSISPGIVSYEWFLIDFPFEYSDEYFPGRVDEIFGIHATSPSISLDFGSLKPGDWQFQLNVEDGEGNSDHTNFSVSVVDEEAPPFVLLSAPIYHLTDVSGLISSDLQISGTASFDLDNILAGDPISFGLGINQYSWNYFSSPSGCSPPTLPTAGMTSSFNLYGNGDFVSPECLGTYQVQLTVTDDDAIPKTASGETSVTIYNCPSLLCITYPTNLNPEFVEFTDDTDVIIYYSLNSLLYDLPLFDAGLIAQLEIFHESDITSPVYTDYDPNVLGTDKGSILSFQWDGFYSNNERPESGLYHLNISLLDFMYTSTIHTTSESEAIWIEVVEPVIEPSSTKYVDYDELSIGADHIEIDYSFTGTQPDELIWRILDESSALLMEGSITPPYTSSFIWDGIDATSTIIPPGHYEIELVARRGSDVLGTSELHGFYVYQFDISSPTGALSNVSPGLRIMVNNDDDNQNNTSDLNDIFPTEDDLVQFDISVEPTNLQGEFTLSVTNTSNLLAWENAQKGSQIIFPSTTTMPGNAPPTIAFLEGQQAGESTLSLSFNTVDGIALNAKDVVVTFYEIRLMEDTNNNNIVDAGDSHLYYSKIANWENAYDGVFNVNNNLDPANFIEQDLSRFYIAVTDPSANNDPGVSEQTSIKLGVLRANAAVLDDMSDLTLTETGANSGFFVSPSQILTSEDIQVADDPNADDEFAAHDGTVGTVPDDALNDRTHQSNINANVQLSYTSPGAPAAKSQLIPVFQRAPNYRKKVDIEAHVFNEPYQDVGLDGMPGTGDVGEGDMTFTFNDTNGNGNHDVGEDSEPYIDFSDGGVAPLSGAAPGVVDGRGPIAGNAEVQAQINRSDIAWAQAGIEMNLVSTFVDDAPIVAGVDILIDGNTDIPADASNIYASYSAGMSHDVLKVFFTGNIPGANAIAFPPIANILIPAVGNGDHSFVLMSPDLNTHFRTLAHELGHILTNTGHSAADQTEFYPQAALFDDTARNTYRRLKSVTISQSRMMRPIGNFGATGNTLLK